MATLPHFRSVPVPCRPLIGRLDPVTVQILATLARLEQAEKARGRPLLPPALPEQFRRVRVQPVARPLLLPAWRGWSPPPLSPKAPCLSTGRQAPVPRRFLSAR